MVRFLLFLLPAFVAVIIWGPVLSHYYINFPKTSVETTGLARANPGEAVLSEIGEYTPTLTPLSNFTSDPVRTAERLMDGRGKVENFSTAELSSDFRSSDLAVGNSSWQLAYSSLLIPRILLAAYEESGRSKYLREAVEYVLDWAEYESKLWFPKGFIWNDHAVASRAVTLGVLWRHYRTSPTYDPETAARVLDFVSSTGARLADTAQYTFHTNHGVMQNLSLLHLSVAFPDLALAESYKAIALRRFSEQLSFFLNPEGVVLEHSAGYQKFGLQLVGKFFRLMTIANLSIPAQWRDKYAKGLEYYAQIVRPNGSLPRLGDTSVLDRRGMLITEISVDGRASPLTRVNDWRPAQSIAMFPAAGYSVFWDGLREGGGEDRLRQTILTWSYYPGHGHKQADDLSVIIWAAGQEWWTGRGYWPNADARRPEAVSWGAGNGPHLVNEPARSQRENRLLGSASAAGLVAVDVVRAGPDGFAARRQVFHVTPNIWIVVDTVSDDRKRRVRTTWTTDYDVTYRPGAGAGAYILEKPGNPYLMRVFFASSTGAPPKAVMGAVDPFAGWVEFDGRVVRAPAFQFEQPSQGSWSVFLSSLERTAEPAAAGAPKMTDWSGAERWKMEIPYAGGVMTLARDNDVVILRPDPRTRAETIVKLTPPSPSVGPTIGATRAAFSEARKRYASEYKDLIPYRWKMTVVLGVLVVLQELVLVLSGRFVRRHAGTVKKLGIPAWMMMSAWLWWVYFP